MHKSLGNAIEPEEIIKNHGAEMLRLWTASVEFTEDVRISRDHPDAAHRGLPQAAQHVPLHAGQLCTISIRATDAVPGGRTARDRPVDSGARRRLVSRCRVWYDEFEFHKVYRAVYDFATVDLSSIYFDVLKDRLYTSAAEIAGAPQRADRALPPAHALVRLLAPILSFTAEEVWGHMNQPGSVHTALLSRTRRTDRRHRRRRTAKRADNWDRLIEVRETF